MGQISAPRAVSQIAQEAQEGMASRPRGLRRVKRGATFRILSCCIFLLLVLALFLRIRHLNGGHFVYALDDGYIHLALSDQIARGHYGINANEYSAPASSVVWPLLLVPFSGTLIHPYVPLLLSIAAGLVAVYMLAQLAEELAPGAASSTMRVALVVLLFFCANLATLAFLGLEHELQLMLAILCATGLVRVWNGQPLPGWAAVAAALGPAVRYESLAITVTMVLVLAALRQGRRAVLVLAAAVAPLIAFSLYLHHLGLKALPSSVLLKSRQESVGQDTAGRILSLAWSWIAAFRHPVRWPIAMLAATLVYLFLRQRDRRKRLVLGAALVVAGLHLLVGGFGSFHRYESYAAAFLTIVALVAAWTASFIRKSWLLAALVFLAAPYLLSTWKTMSAAHEVYCQQFQMRRFVDDFYRRNVAVNDLGEVSYGRPSQVFVLDLWGLAWYEAGVANRTPEWLEANVAPRNVGLAMLYPEWYSPPASWTHIGELCIDHKPIVIGGRCTAFYGTSPAATAELEPELHRFAQTLPPGSTFHFGPAPARADEHPSLLSRIVSALGF